MLFLEAFALRSQQHGIIIIPGHDPWVVCNIEEIHSLVLVRGMLAVCELLGTGGELGS